MGTKTDSEYFDKQKSKLAESSENRILYVYGLDTLNWENYELKRNLNLTLKKTELDTIVTNSKINIEEELLRDWKMEKTRDNKTYEVMRPKHFNERSAYF